jgi:hypothetical protein
LRIAKHRCPLSKGGGSRRLTGVWKTKAKRNTTPNIAHFQWAIFAPPMEGNSFRILEIKNGKKEHHPRFHLPSADEIHPSRRLWRPQKRGFPSAKPTQSIFNLSCFSLVDIKTIKNQQK